MADVFDQISSGSSGDIFDKIAPSRSWKDEALSFLTMGHVAGEYGPEKEVSFDAEGKMNRVNVPTGDPGFFQDPITALTMGGMAGVKAGAGLVNKGLAAGREALGWLTGGGSEVPALAKAGVKGIVKAAEAKPLAKAAEARQAKGVLESIAPEAKVSGDIFDQVRQGAAETAPKVAAPIVKQPNSGEMYWPESDEARFVFDAFKNQLKEGATKQVMEKEGEVFVAGSSYPQWFRDLSKKYRVSADETISLMDKYLSGKKELTDRQANIFGDIVNAATKAEERKIYGKIAEAGELKISALDLQVGDELTKAGEKFKVIGEDADGFLTIKDGETFRASPDDMLPFDSVKRGGREVTGDLEGFGFKDTFDLTNPETEIGTLTSGRGPQTASLNSLIPEVRGGATGELPKYAEGSAINLERLNTTEDVKQFINARTQEAEAKIGKRTVSWDETRATAESLGWDEKAIRKEWNKKGAFSAAEIDATRQTNLNAIESLQNAIRDLPAGATRLTPEIRAQVLDVMDTIKVTSQAASEAGRALNIHKRVLSNDPSFKEASEMARVLNAISGKGTKRTDALIEGLRELDMSDTAAVNRFVYNATKTPWQKLSNGAFELWLNGLLSNPLTHIVNTTSNALTMAYQYPERLLGAGIEAVRAGATGTKKGIFFGETAQDIFSISKGLQDAVSRFGKTMRQGERITKLDYTPSALPDSVAKLLPTRALAAEDAFFKGFIENQELNRLAFRQAKKEGLAGTEFERRVTDLLLMPQEGMLKESARRAEYLTYQKEVGEVGRLIFNARDKVPGLKYFIPFVKTPLNIAKFALERTPLNLPILAARAIKGDLKGAQLSEELAKPLMGTMLATTVYQLAEQGYITGGTPKQKAAREEKQNVGWQPYSVKIGDKYYSFARMEPLGSILGMAADLSQIKKEAQEDEKFNLASGIMGSITTNISNKTFMQGFTNMIQAMSDPGRYGANVVKTLAGSVVPAVSGGVARSVDEKVRDVQGPLDTIKSRIPGVSRTMPEKLTVWGESIQKPGSAAGRMLSPMQISQEKGSPIEKELLKLNLDIGYPSRKIKDYEIPQDEYWKMVKSAGEPAKRQLDKIASSERWGTLPDGIKEKVISTIVEQFRDAERRKMEARLMGEGKIKVKPW